LKVFSICPTSPGKRILAVWLFSHYSQETVDLNFPPHKLFVCSPPGSLALFLLPFGPTPGRLVSPPHEECPGQMSRPTPGIPGIPGPWVFPLRVCHLGWAPGGRMQLTLSPTLNQIDFGPLIPDNFSSPFCCRSYPRFVYTLPLPPPTALLSLFCPNVRRSPVLQFFTRKKTRTTLGRRRLSGDSQELRGFLHASACLFSLSVVLRHTTWRSVVATGSPSSR